MAKIELDDGSLAYNYRVYLFVMSPAACGIRSCLLRLGYCGARGAIGICLGSPIIFYLESDDIAM